MVRLGITASAEGDWGHPRPSQRSNEGTQTRRSRNPSQPRERIGKRRMGKPKDRAKDRGEIFAAIVQGTRRHGAFHGRGYRGFGLIGDDWIQ